MLFTASTFLFTVLFPSICSGWWKFEALRNIQEFKAKHAGTSPTTALFYFTQTEFRVLIEYFEISAPTPYSGVTIPKIWYTEKTAPFASKLQEGNVEYFVSYHAQSGQLNAEDMTVDGKPMSVLLFVRRESQGASNYKVKFSNPTQSSTAVVPIIDVKVRNFSSGENLYLDMVDLDCHELRSFVFDESTTYTSVDPAVHHEIMYVDELSRTFTVQREEDVKKMPKLDLAVNYLFKPIGEPRPPTN